MISLQNLIEMVIQWDFNEFSMRCSMRLPLPRDFKET